ncbi:MAG: hypothetical protein J5606_07565, partial [Bacteroidales bacterium]|nr:hypothetical protein [Bacteroidales bacterium]
MKKVILLLGSFLIFLQVAQAQTTATNVDFNVGTSTTTSSYSPNSSGLSNSWTRILYTAAEVGGTVIDTVAWQLSSKSGSGDIVNQYCFMKVVPGSAAAITDVFSSTAHVDPLADGATLVWQGTIPASVSTGWIYFPLDTPFAVPTGYALVIYFEHRAGHACMSTYWKSSAAGTMAQSSGSASGAGTSDTKRPYTRFLGMKYDGPILDSARRLFYSDLAVAINDCNTAGTTYSPYKLLVFDSATIGTTGTIDKNIEIDVFSSITNTKRVITRTATTGYLSVKTGTLNLKDLVFDGDKSHYTADSAMIATKGTLVMNNCQFKNCKNSRKGGAILTLGGTLTTNGTDTLIVENNESGNGGGIAISVGTLTFNSPVRVSDNTTTGAGGGFYRYSGGVITFNSTLIVRGNTAVGKGGGIYGNQGDDDTRGFTMNGYAIIENNTTSNTGGGFYLQHGYMRFYGNAIIKDNTASSGGGFYEYYGHIYVGQDATHTSDIVFENNTAGNGGGFYQDYGRIYCYGNTTFIGNNATTASGGGFYNAHNHATDFYGKLIVKNNTAKTNGGGFYNVQPMTVQDSCIVTGNTAGSNGGGIYNT